MTDFGPGGVAARAEHRRALPSVAGDGRTAVIPFNTYIICIRAIWRFGYLLNNNNTYFCIFCYHTARENRAFSCIFLLNI